MYEDVHIHTYSFYVLYIKDCLYVSVRISSF